MKRLRFLWTEHWLRRLCKHEAYHRFLLAFVGLPFMAWVLKTRGRFRPLGNTEEESFYSGAQYVASIGRNQFGFETRATKSFEHAMSVILGKDILGHILSQDNDIFRQEELGDEDKGLSGDFAEEDIIDLRKELKHEPHVGIVYFRPDRHYLNEKPNDLLSPYKVVGEAENVLTSRRSNNHH